MRKEIDIAVIAPSIPEDFFALLWEGVRSAASELSSFGVKVQTYQTPHHGDKAQARLLRDLLDSQFAAIAIVPAHGAKLNEVIAAHTERGRPVITFHTDAPGSTRCCYVGTSAPEAGTLAAEALAKFMGGRGKFASFPGDLAFPQFAQRYQGFKDGLHYWSDELLEVFCQGGLDDLPAALGRCLEEHADLGGIYVGSARTYQVAAAFAERGLRIPFVGFDNIPAVRPFLLNGTVSAVIDESVHQQGYMAVQRAYEICRAPADKPLPWVRVPSSLVLASNSAEGRVGETLSGAFEQLIRQQTAQSRSYQDKLEEANRKLIQLAETDGLTGLLNRRKFEEILPAALEKAAGGGNVSLLMVDVDSFKDCNDNYGHPVGDEALRTIARVLQESARDSDYCARLGGDEFCVLLVDADASLAATVRERIGKTLMRTSVSAGNVKLFIRASVGVATFPADAETADALIIAADRSMYGYKRQSKASLHTLVQETITI